MRYVRAVFWAISLSITTVSPPDAAAKEAAADRTDLPPPPRPPRRSSSTARAPSYRISEAAQERFQRPSTRKSRWSSTTRDRWRLFSRYLQGEVDIVDASRPAKPDEESKAKAQGIEWSRFVVGYDGITLVVNPKNDFVKIALRRAVEDDLGALEQGQDLEGHRPGLARTGRSSSTRRTATRAPSSFSPKRSSARPRASATTCNRAPTTTRSSSAWPVTPMVSAISVMPTSRPTKTSFGPWPFRMARAPNRCFPSPATIADKTYAPLSRPLYIYVKNSAARRPEVAKFLKFYLEND